MENIWAGIKGYLKDQLPAHSYRMWIEPISLGSLDESEIVLLCPNLFSQKRVRDNYLQVISDAFLEKHNKRYNISFGVGKGSESTGRGTRRTASAQAPIQLSLPTEKPKLMSGRLLRDNYTFDRFVVGNNSDFAYTAALSLASKNRNHTNSLFLLSDTGLGKSHLSQAVGHQILAKNPGERVYYISAEDFAGEMVGAMQTDSLDTFKEKYRNNCDVLLMEDVHFLTGKTRTQTELVQILDYLYESNKKVIFSSCHLPGEIPKINDQLKSRLSSGMITNIEPPNFRTRVRILKRKALDYGFAVPMDVMEYLASELSDNVRQLESGILGVTTKSSLLGIPLDLSLAGTVVKNMVKESKKITIDFIKELVCSEYKVTTEELESNSRKKTVVTPRQVAIYLSRRYTDQPLQVIGKSFNRYHATAIHSINSIEKAIKLNSPISKQVAHISKKIEHGRV
ncbi:chromosomal replication initiator protein DnaA [Desulforegula conservatrix]|uniref:chromosomal replication initiator protein DnaA n=1 Tax=Desulforegula conservatrix TaxID=153026 RepID=UPI0003FB3F3B|nr:chromosomal replication initiator protein DnaA [Desulforegula conservatrix]